MLGFGHQHVKIGHRTRADPSDKGQVAAGSVAEGIKFGRKPVMHRQLAPGIAARCASDIEASGILENSRISVGGSGRSRRQCRVVSVVPQRGAKSWKCR